MAVHIDMDALQAWTDRSEVLDETLEVAPAWGLAATLGLDEQPGPGWQLPPMWHQLYFLNRTPSTELGEDGASRNDPLLPPVPLPELMWAGAELSLHAPLRLGVPTRRTSRITQLSLKNGSRGPMVFVTLERELAQGGQVAVVERTQTVFLGPAVETSAARPVKPGAEATREQAWLVNEAVLFRFSALTFNAHRIHYDLSYATRQAGYPTLVVHGPLQALLLAETFRQWHPARVPSSIVFRARAPLFAGEPVRVCAAPDAAGENLLWTESKDGGVAMAARFIEADAPRPA
jgi:3-methylfumaryl-CoA hydratase